MSTLEQKLRAYTLVHKHEADRAKLLTGNGMTFETSKPSNTSPPTRLHFQILPKCFYQLRATFNCGAVITDPSSTICTFHYDCTHEKLHRRVKVGNRKPIINKKAMSTLRSKIPLISKLPSILASRRW